MKVICYLCAIIITLLTLSTNAHSSVPFQISFQGRLTNANGDSLTTNVYPMKFTLYSVPSGGDPLWQTTGYVPVLVESGVFVHILGSSNALPDSLIKCDSLFLGVQVGLDNEMTPRTHLGSTFFALKSAASDRAETAERAAYSDSAMVSLTAIWSDSADYAISAATSLTSDTALAVIGSGIYRRLAVDNVGGSVTITDGNFRQIGQTLSVGPGLVDSFIVVLVKIHCLLANARYAGVGASYSIRLSTTAGETVMDQGGLGSLSQVDAPFQIGQPYFLEIYYEPTLEEKLSGFEVKVYLSGSAQQFQGAANVVLQKAEVFGL